MKDTNGNAGDDPKEAPQAIVEMVVSRTTAGRGASPYGDGSLVWGVIQDTDLNPEGYTRDVDIAALDSTPQPECEIACTPSTRRNERLHGSLMGIQTANLARRQILENEQYIVLGRLTAHLCHSINNSLQALRGALTLTLEEPEVPQAIVDYVRLCQGEVQRQAAMVDRMRQVYRPNGDAQAVDLQALLDDVVALTSEEAERLGIEVHQDVGSEMPIVRGSGSKLRLIFLSLVLRLMDLAVMTGRSSLRLQAAMTEQDLRIEVSLDGGPADRSDKRPWLDVAPEALGGQLALSTIRDLAFAQGGELGVLAEGRDVGIWVTLPI